MACIERVAVDGVQMRAQVRRQLTLVDEEALQRLERGGVLDGSVELDAIAGRYNHRLADAGHADQAAQRIGQRVAGEGDPLAHLDGRGLVREPHDSELPRHGYSCVPPMPRTK